MFTYHIFWVPSLINRKEAIRRKTRCVYLIGPWGYTDSNFFHLSFHRFSLIVTYAQALYFSIEKLIWLNNWHTGINSWTRLVTYIVFYKFIRMRFNAELLKVGLFSTAWCHFKFIAYFLFHWFPLRTMNRGLREIWEKW